MIFREAVSADIPAIQFVRNSVKENRLSDPGLVPDSDVEDYINRRGKGWVCEINGQVIGFAIADLQKENIWALFILPQYEGKGIGKKLHDDMMNWYFDQGIATVWLSTSPGTRAETFYRQSGWKEAGLYGKGETKFEMTADQWSNLS